MTAYNFLPRFIDPIIRGAKRQTIRAPRLGRSRHAIPGEMLQLYTGMRTKQCRLIGTAVCVSAVPIEMRFSDPPTVTIGSRCYIDEWDLKTFAIADGFPDWPAMLAFWRETHPEPTDSFSGVIVEWGGFTAAGVGL